MLRYRAAVMLGAFVLDFLMGDPAWLPHPVVMMGKLISFLENKLRKSFPKTDRGERIAGTILVLIVCVLCFCVPFLVIWFAYRTYPYIGVAFEIFFCGQLLAARSLRSESMKVYEKLKNGTLDEARYAVSMIVGRDTGNLSREGVTRAAVETVAENTSDGVIAPMFYMALGGAPLMFLYKAINTMDSMLGYKNERYLWFGRCAAKLDDAANYVPARLSALLMIAASTAGFDPANAFRIYKRDRRKHASPNSAQTESVMAGALHIQLAGDASYFGKIYKKPFIGNPDREVEDEDIPRACRLMYFTSIIGLAVFAGISYIFKVFRMI